jgi:hypothetical protein
MKLMLGDKIMQDEPKTSCSTSVQGEELFDTQKKYKV